jgi:hypothetical protein
MGRRPIGRQAMSDAERQQKRRDKLRENPVEMVLNLVNKLDPDQRKELFARLNN